MQQITKVYNVYKFNELSDKAKEYARDKYRENFDFSLCSDYVFEECKELFKLLGVSVDRFYYSGFSSQGDGACFTGSYAFTYDAIANIKKHAPNDLRLYNIACRLDALQSKVENKLSAKITHNSRYYHENSVTIDVTHENEDLNFACYGEQAYELKDCLKDLMKWLYKSLESNYDYFMSNESIDENILANDYDFLENGSIF